MPGQNAKKQAIVERSSAFAEGPQILCRLVGGAGGGEDRLAVALQDAQPVADVIGMVGLPEGGPQAGR